MSLAATGFELVTKRTRVYHAVAGGETHWHDYAWHVIERARAAGKPVRVAPGAHQGHRQRRLPDTGSAPG
jgi:dTDP-4-dehydrorhamnose reductase